MNEPTPRLPTPPPWAGGPVHSFPELAGYGRRLAARVIDIVVTVGIPAIVAVLLDAWADTSSLFLVLYLVPLGFSFLNDVLLTAVAGGTIGKLMLGTRVVRVEDRRPITAGGAMYRWAAMMVLNFIPFMGLVDSVWIFSGEMQQTLHDKAAGTMVVRARLGAA